MQTHLNNWLRILIFIVGLPVVTGWDSVVGMPALSIALMWIISGISQSLKRTMFGLYLSGWLSWWWAVPWWQSAALILLLMSGQKLINPKLRHYQGISLVYLLISILVAAVLLGSWSQDIGFWSMLGWLTTVIVMALVWVWMKKGPISNVGTSWYVQ